MSARRPARSRMTALAVIGVAAVALAACSSGTSTSTETTAAAATASAAPSKSAGPASSSAAPAFEKVGCETFGLEPFIAEIADCGYVTVPENRTSGSDRTIKLGVVRVKAIGENPGLPVMRGSGGPGGPGLGNATQANLLKHQPLLQNHDFVFFTQRGTKLAEPFLDCAAYNEAGPAGLAAGSSDDEIREARKAAYQACIDDFTAQGVDLSAYTTSENAADVVDISAALGYDKFLYYGASYGTQLGQFLAKEHPDAVAGLALDGVVPLTATKMIQVTDIPGSFTQIWDACAADKACNAAYPDPEGELRKVVDSLNAKPVTLKVDVKGTSTDVVVNGQTAMAAISDSMVQSGFNQKLPYLVYQMSAGELQTALAPLVATRLDPGDTANVQHYAINCSDDPMTQADIATATNVVDPLYAGLVADQAIRDADACDALGLTQLPDSTDTPLTGDIPTLLLQGGLDPYTPVSGGDTVVNGLTKVTNVTIPGGKHVQIAGDACAVTILAAFADDPTSTLDTSCIDPSTGMLVALTPTVTSADGKASLTAALPIGMKENGPNQYQSLTTLVLLQALPKQDPDKAIDDTVKLLKAIQPVGEISDGPKIAGQPSRHFTGTADGYAKGAGTDIYAFSDKNGTYVITTAYSDAGTLESVFRANDLPAMLASVELGK
jgi:pimeloyl-ACP methyl ester carboxylesterase